MDEAARLAALLHQLVDQRQDGVADIVGLVAQEVEVERLEAAARGDLIGGLGRDDAAGRLGLGQRHLDLDVTLDQGMVGEDRAHRGSAECVAEQERIDDGGGGCGNRAAHGILRPLRERRYYVRTLKRIFYVRT